MWVFFIPNQEVEMRLLFKKAIACRIFPACRPRPANGEAPQMRDRGQAGLPGKQKPPIGAVYFIF